MANPPDAPANRRQPGRRRDTPRRPSWLEAAAVAQRPDERRPDERGVGDRDALERARARARGRYVAQPQLLDPAVLSPNAGPRGIDVELALLAGPSSAPASRAIRRRRRRPVRIRRRPSQRIAGRRKERIIDDDAVPRRTLETQRNVGAHSIGTPQISLAGGFPPQPPRDRQAARIDDRGVRSDQSTANITPSRSPAAHCDVELGGLEANEFPLDAHARSPYCIESLRGSITMPKVAGIDRRFSRPSGVRRCRISTS